MSTKLILTTTVDKLGNEGDAVTVADGYARNYLLPKKLGVPATPANLKRMEVARKKREADLAAQVVDARSVVEKLARGAFTITASASADGRLFGSVTAADIAAVLKAEGIEVDRRKIVLEHPIHELGTFDVEVKLHPEVVTKVKIWVVAEGTDAASPPPAAPAAEPKPKKSARKQTS